MQRVQSQNGGFPLKGIIKSIIAIVVLAVASFGVKAMWQEVPSEKIVVNQVPFTGTMNVWDQPGLYLQKGGDITEYYKTQQLWFGEKDDEGNMHGQPINVTFSDGSAGVIYGSVRVELPVGDATHMLKIQESYKGMDRLMSELVKTNVGKVVFMTGPLVTAFESYAEKKNDLIYYINDQLTYGVYKTKKTTTEVYDTLTHERKTVTSTKLISNPSAPGGYERSEESPFKKYGVNLTNLSISRIDYSETVNKQIAQQQEANMLIQTSKARAAAAQQEAVRAEEEGKAEAAKAKWEQEKLKATAVTQAEQEKEVAKLEAEKAKWEKERIVQEGEAKAAANRALVAAGLTPAERAEWDYKTTVGVAEALAKSQQRWVPEIMMGNSTGGSNPLDAVGLKMMMDIANSMKK